MWITVYGHIIENEESLKDFCEFNDSEITEFKNIPKAKIFFISYWESKKDKSIVTELIKKIILHFGTKVDVKVDRLIEKRRVINKPKPIQLSLDF